MNRVKAFTLIEMMAVVVIIGILAAVIAPKFFHQVGSAEITAAKQDIRSIEQAISLYRMDTGGFPDTLRDLTREPDNVRRWNGPYLPHEPKDPWGNRYEYIAPGNDGRPFDVWSLGADGQDGGEDDAADITSWKTDED
ncbi:MAG: type II secretion system major pseudopilin GspG [Acidobacteria bacterium]|nr:type II secretion system major pseudopilin GspG [Acidobacteriota bacterium]